MAWWEEVTFYQIYPRSFADANGDGSSESSIMLPNLSESQLQALKNLDPRIEANRHKTSEQKVVISWGDPS